MINPFVRSWSISFSALQGNRAPNNYPFGSNARVTIVESPLSFIIEHGNRAPIPLGNVVVTSGDPWRIDASGDIADPDIKGHYRFRAYLTTDFLGQKPFVVGVFSWNLDGPPAEDPPDTGGWVGGATNPPEE